MAEPKMFTTWDGLKIHAEKANSDANGNSITLGFDAQNEKVVSIGGKAIAGSGGDVPTVNNAKLKLQLGDGEAVDTGFTANASSDATITIPQLTGATSSNNGAIGLVPAPAVADKDKFLKGDGTWADVGGGGGGGADLPPYSDEDKAVLANQAGNLSWDKGFASTSYVEDKINDFIVNAPLEGGGSAGNFKSLSLCYDDSLELVENEDHPGWTYQLSVKTPLPVPDSGYSDEGKILRVGIANELEWVNSSAVVEVDNTTMQYDQYGSLEVKLPIPDPTNNDGKVLTVEHNTLTNTDDVVWKDAGGGGGGGNPYTKVLFTPGAPYANDHYEYSQDLNVSNNTYSISSQYIGYDYVEDIPRPISEFINVKLPAGTEFPMAVVEFTIADYSYANKIRVFVGSTELTRLYPAPYTPDILVGKWDGDYFQIEMQPEESAEDWKADNWYNVDPRFSIMKFNSFGENTKIQVHIFGNCYRVEVDRSTVAS